jgi:hypothetical protein
MQRIGFSYRGFLQPLRRLLLLKDENMERETGIEPATSSLGSRIQKANPLKSIDADACFETPKGVRNAITAHSLHTWRAYGRFQLNTILNTRIPPHHFPRREILRGRGPSLRFAARGIGHIRRAPKTVQIKIKRG